MSQSSLSSGSGGSGPSGSTTQFQAYLNAPFAVAGNAAATIIFNQAITNIGSAYNTGTGIFTAPATGYYCFSTTVYFNNMNSLVGNNQTLLGYTGSAQSLRINHYGSGANVVGPPASITLTSSWGMPMTAGETVKVQPFANGTGNYEIFGAPGPSSTAFFASSSFSGWRLA